MKLNTHTQTTLLLTLVTAIMLSSGYLYLNNNLRKHSDQNIRNELQKLTALAKYTIERDIPPQNNADLFDAIADRIGRDLKLRATIIALDGRVLGDSALSGDTLRALENHSHRPEVQAAMRHRFGESQRYSTTLNQNMRYTAMLFEAEGSTGLIRLALPLSAIEQRSARIRGIIGVSLLAIFILGVFINYAASAWISKPVQEMSKAAKRIADGDFSKISTLSLQGEIADLGEAFNTMSRQLATRLKEMDVSRSRLEAVLLSMFEGVLVVDANGGILLVNQALRDFFHIQQEVAGRNAIEVIRNLKIAEIIDRAVHSQCRVAASEITILSPQEKVLSVYGTPVLRNGQSEGAILVFHDITNVRRLEKIRQDFVANVSHELKTPVASIKGYAETLLEGAIHDSENAEPFLKIIHDDAERLALLIEDLLSLSKIESGKLNINFEPTDLFPIIQKVAQSLRPQSLGKSVRIDVKTPETLPQVPADKTRITQVFFNLIDNAIKYNKTGGTVRVSAKTQKNTVEIEITDNGIGIPKADLPRLFERFYRVDKGRSRALGGTGLGLSIVKHIVKAHNGDIRVESELGKGTTFTLTLPKSV
ncbi:MAG: two-component system histidine kinase PnpS [Nitrospiria bacterium]